MITLPLLPSKRAVSATPFGRESEPGANMARGQSFGQWQSALKINSSLAHPLISGIRLYERYFYLSQQLFLTP